MERMIVFLRSAFTHHKDSVAIDDRRQSMSNDQHGTLLKSLSQLRLDEVVRLQVDICCSLIQHKNLSVPDDCAS